MNDNNVAVELLLIPHKFHCRGNMSTYDLLKETGYFAVHAQISEASIHEALTEHPECVDEWMRYSEDKRTSSGWYFKQEDEYTYIVGFFSGKAGENIQLKFTDRIVACAAFVKRESESIRQAG